MKSESYFSRDFFDFFKELKKHNNRVWFNTNKQRYINSVKEPFERYVSDVIQMVHQHDPLVQISPKEAIFRIYRDVRFSKDKSPYKTSVSAVVSPKGRKFKEDIGIYIELSDDKCRIYSGVYMPDKEMLYRIREYICDYSDKFLELISDRKFRETFGEIRGEKNKIIPKEFKPFAARLPLLYNKQFYFFTELSPDIIISEKLLSKTEEVYLTAKPLIDFLSVPVRG
ncbi:MAG: DUF2461 domain-containing protein [Bacteroidetes bacterium]|nr:MAG: DUF2461 domain-containing protein [Bacteroidota bacterium]